MYSGQTRTSCPLRSHSWCCCSPASVLAPAAGLSSCSDLDPSPLTCCCPCLGSRPVDGENRNYPIRLCPYSCSGS